jgi:hypothetical protein
MGGSRPDPTRMTDPTKRRKHRPESSKTTDPSKQRRYPRYPLDVRVSAKVFREDAPIELWGRSIEFGQDGIGITLTGELVPGEVATLELTLPGGGAPLKIRALVRYRDGLRHGFEFLARDTIQREAIRRTCELLAVGR